MESKINTARSLFESKFPDQTATTIAVAPGRVNLIGEHTDYTGGFVLPFAIEYATVVLGRGSVSDKATNKERSASLKFISDKDPEAVQSFDISESSTPPQETAWTTYVVGTVYQYLQDLPSNSHLDLAFTISGDVPLGSGLSSSAALEVSVARFVEAVLGGESAFSAETSGNVSPAKVRALRCQKAENEWFHSPCGIMDQAVSSAAKDGSLLLIDCRSLAFTETRMAEAKEDDNTPQPVLVVANSNVQHDIAGGEYPVRVSQCQTATEALQKVNSDIRSLRDATQEDVEKAKDLMDDVIYKRVVHVVSENERTLQAKEELEKGDWTRVGELMNESHASMRDDYQVSCEEVDVLVDIAQKYPGVYGSRLTGGGFGGCTVTLVSKDKAEELMDHMQQEYKARTGKHCPCFVTRPSRGAHLVSIKNSKPFV